MRHRRYSGFVLEGWRNPAATTILTDRSRFKNNGAFTGATWVQLPTGAWVMDFTNAANLVTIPAAASINDMPEMTFECWVKIVGTGPFGTGQLLNKGSNFIIYRNDPGKRFVIALVHSTSGASWILGAVNSVLDGVWCHLSISKGFNSASPAYRINGVNAAISIGTPASGIPLSNAVTGLTLGNRADGALFLNGYMSAPKIYNYLRTEQQALAAFNAERYLYGV